MARIVIRKRKPDSGINSSVGNGNDPNAGAAQPYVGNVVFTPEPIAGEPDSSDIAAASDDNQPDGTGSTDSDTDSGSRYVDPTSATDPGTGTRPRRGRKPGSRNKQRTTSTTQTTQDLSAILLASHYMLSKLLKDDIWKLTKDEASEMGKAVTRVTQLYDIQIIPEKQMAWLNLTMVGAAVYGPRVMATGKKGKGPQVVEMPAQFVPGA